MSKSCPSVFTILFLIMSIRPAFSGSAAKLALAPPWIVFNRQMIAALGEYTKGTPGSRQSVDPCLGVSWIQGEKNLYTMDIHESCGSAERAQAVATLLGGEYPFGNILVRVSVKDFKGAVVPAGDFPPDPETAADLIRAGLSGNRYFLGFKPGNGIIALFVEFKMGIAQYRADNTSDYYGNNNEVVADLFKRILVLKKPPRPIALGTTTEDQV